MTTRFRLLTANLLHGRSDPRAFAGVVADHDPDVVVVQELGPGPADVLASAYPNVYLRPALDFSGRGIASRFEGSMGDLEMPGRVGVAASLRVDGVLVRVAGVHLLNPVHFPWWVMARRREEQVGELFRWLDEETAPTVVVGDFNASPIWPAYKRVSSRLEDLVVASGEPQRATWGYRPGWPKMLRIDHIFGSGVAASGIRTPLVDGSDHTAVVADIEVTDAA